MRFFLCSLSLSKMKTNKFIALKCKKISSRVAELLVSAKKKMHELLDE